MARSKPLRKNRKKKEDEVDDEMADELKFLTDDEDEFY